MYDIITQFKLHHECTLKYKHSMKSKCKPAHPFEVVWAIIRYNNVISIVHYLLVLVSVISTRCTVTDIVQTVVIMSFLVIITTFMIFKIIENMFIERIRNQKV